MAHRMVNHQTLALSVLGSFAVLLLAGSAWLFVSAAGSFLDNFAFARRAERVTGEVVRYQLSSNPNGTSSRRCPWRYPVFAFDLPGGERVEAVGRVAECPARFEIGTRLDILYDTALPTRAVPEQEENIYLPAMVSFGAGLLIGLAGAALAFGWWGWRRLWRDVIPPRAWPP